WLGGGRAKSFAEFTPKIGWVDPSSELYALGVRPGDEVIAYDGYAFSGHKDHLYAPMISKGSVTVNGLKIDYETGERVPFEHTIQPYSHPAVSDKNVRTAGIINSASYIIYDRLPN